MWPSQNIWTLIPRKKTYHFEFSRKISRQNLFAEIVPWKPIKILTWSHKPGLHRQVILIRKHLPQSMKKSFLKVDIKLKIKFATSVFHKIKTTRAISKAEQKPSRSQCSFASCCWLNLESWDINKKIFDRKKLTIQFWSWWAVFLVCQLIFWQFLVKKVDWTCS